MDNHMAALWCWLQMIDLNNCYNYFHIDRHDDLLDNFLDSFPQDLEKEEINLSNLSIQEYIALENKHIESGMKNYFRYDNYFMAFLRVFPGTINKAFLATHEDSDYLENWIDYYRAEIYELQENLNYWITKEKGSYQTILNIDIDYFFSEKNGIPFRLLTDEYIREICKEIDKSLEKIDVVTIALSPEFCGNWEDAIYVIKIFSEYFNLEFEI